MTIKIWRYTFEGPFSSLDSLEDKSGVYALLCRGDQGYSVLDVGESARVRSRIENHERVACWHDNCEGTLAYAVLYTPGKRQSGRHAIELGIRIEVHGIPCGEQ